MTMRMDDEPVSDHTQSVFHEKKCSYCGARRLKRRDGSAGICSFVHCAQPFCDVDMEKHKR